MAYEATAELYKRQYDLAKKRAQSDYEQAVSRLAADQAQASQASEANLEARGILRSGEAQRERVRLGAAEKSARLAAETAKQSALDQAGLSYMQQLAGIQAGSGTTASPAATSPVVPDKPGNAPAGYEYVWDGNKYTLKAIDLSGVNWSELGKYMEAMKQPVRPTKGAF